MYAYNSVVQISFVLFCSHHIQSIILLVTQCIFSASEHVEVDKIIIHSCLPLPFFGEIILVVGWYC